MKRSCFLVALFLGLLEPGRLCAGDSPAASGITEPFLDVTVGSSVAGIVAAHRFKEGELVKEGEVLVEFDKKLEELETERRKLVAEQKKKDFETTQVLWEKTKGTRKEEVEKAEVEYKVAAVEHAQAVEQLNKRLITAPLTGTIAEFYLEVGEPCQPYQPVLRVVDTRRCYFVANIEAKAAAPLKLGQAVQLEIDTGAAPVTVQGKMVYLSPVVDPASGLLRVKALFDNADGKVRPGLAGKMHLELIAHAN